MSAWGRGSERPRSRVGFMVWIVVGMTLGMIISIAAVLIAYPGIDIDERRELERVRTELQETRDRLVEQDRELTTLREILDGAGPDDNPSGSAERIRSLESQNVQMAEEIRVLNGRLEVAQQVTEELQAALDKAPLGDVDELKKQLADRDNSLKQLDAGYAELIAKVDELTTERDRLRGQLAARTQDQSGDRAAGGAAQAEASGDAEQLRSALSAAETEAADLQKQVGETRTAIAERDKALRDLDAEISRLAPLEAEVAKLRERLAAAGDGATQNGAELQANLDRAEAETLNLRQELAAAVSKRDAAEALVGQRDRELAAARSEVSERDKALEELDSEVSRLAPLEAEVTRLGNELAAAKATAEASGGSRSNAELAQAQAEAKRLGEELAAAQARLETAAAAAQTREQELAQANDALAKSEAALAEVKAEQQRLQQEIARLTSTLESQAGAAEDRQGDDSAADADRDRAPTPRDPELVAKAMLETPGLGDLDAPGRDRLATDLIEGECVAISLSKVLGRAPPPIVRDLILKLDSDC